jgi:hypothetical protein
VVVTQRLEARAEVVELLRAVRVLRRLLAHEPAQLDDGPALVCGDGGLHGFNSMSLEAGAHGRCD